MESPIESDFNDYGPTALAYSSAVPQSLVGRAEPDWIAGFEESKKTNGQSAGLKKRLYLPVPQQMAKPPRKEAPNLTPSQPRPNGKSSIDLLKGRPFNFLDDLNPVLPLHHDFDWYLRCAIEPTVSAKTNTPKSLSGASFALESHFISRSEKKRSSRKKMKRWPSFYRLQASRTRAASRGNHL